MSVSPLPLPLPAPRPIPGEIERKAVVYVLRDHVRGRTIVPTPHNNAAETDLAEIYALDRLVGYPVVRDRFESRRLAEVARRRDNLRWALDALDAIYRGVPVPGRRRQRFEQALRSLAEAGPDGVTRKEVCRRWGVDGGKVSGALTTLHDSGVCFPLVGVKR